MSAATSSKFNHVNSQKTNGTNGTYSSWSPPSSFSVTSEGDRRIFLVDKTIKRNKQPPQPFSLTPMNNDESLALSGWDDESDDIKYDLGKENSVDRNLDFRHSSYSSHSSHSSSNTVTYDNDDDNDDTASVATCSTATTTTTTSSDYPSVLHVTIADLVKMQQRRNSLQQINNYNMTVDTTPPVSPVSNKNKQKIVNFKDEIVESPVEGSLKNSVPPRSNNSNDSSTVRDNNSSQHDEISISPSLGLPKISPEEFKRAKLEKQNILRGWVKCLWPQPRLPSTKYLATKLNANSLLTRNLNPLTIGVIVTTKSGPMISTIIVSGTKHSNERIEKNGKIKFVGTPHLNNELYDPREYLLLHCPTFHNPPYNGGDPRITWSEKFLLNKVLPKLAAEASEIQNEASLYLTIRETQLRGLGQFPIYGCKSCPPPTNNTNIKKTFTYDEIREHLNNEHLNRNGTDEDMIRINLRAYVTAFYKNLPPKIVLR